MRDKSSSKSSHSVCEPWVGKEFLKDTGKLRARERYWHTLGDSYTGNGNLLETASAALGVVQDEDCPIVVPDALSLRKYLRLFKHVLTHSPDMARWILLESVVEYMDYRNQAPVLQSRESDETNHTTMSEMAAPQERSTIQKLIKEGKIVPFCDLSIRNDSTGNSDQGEDEWGWLNYEALSIDARSQHALLRAARFLQEDQKRKRGQEGINIVLLVDDLDKGAWDSLRLDEGIIVQSAETFFTSFVQRIESQQQEQIAHLIQSCQEEYSKRNAPKDEYHQAVESSVQEYWSEDRVLAGLQKKTLLRGRINFTKENPKEAFVRVDGKHWFVDANEGHHNRALQQDIVILEALSEEKWGRPMGRRRLVSTNDNNKGEDDAIRKDESLSYPTFPSARVVAIHEMSRRSFVATMVDIPLPEESAVLVVPMDICIPKIRLPTKAWQKFAGMRLLVHVDGWEVGSNYPHGRVSEILGPIGDLETEVSCLLCENQVRLEPFSVAAQSCLPPQGSDWTIPESELESRRDLRKTHRIFSVDPVGCQDIDDTMHARYLENGDIEIGVHIADVTHFVPLDSPLDREARIRGTTFYLVDRRFDMLPSLLSSNLCSLHGQTDRLAVSVIWTLSNDLETIKSTWYGRTVIHNIAAMTYEQAANILDGKKPEKDGEAPPPPLTAGAPVDPKLIAHLKNDLGLLTKLARKRRKQREDIGGAVDLSSGDLGGELKFSLVDGKPVAVKPKQDLEIHHTIAELMIWANTSVATKIYERFPGSALLRIHQEVGEDRFEDLREMLSAGNLQLEGKTNMELADSLKKAENKSIPVVASLFRSLATRAMSEALYVSTGDTKEGQNLSHYGLGLTYYTHFTSPIRRYADCVVHFQLMASLVEKESGTQKPAKHQALPQLPDSTVISMLAEGQSDRFDALTRSGDDGGDEVMHDDIKKSNTDELLSVDMADLEIDDLIGGAADLLVDGDTNQPENEIDSIDDLIGGAADLLLGHNSDDEAEADDEVDALLGDVDDLLVGNTELKEEPSLSVSKWQAAPPDIEGDLSTAPGSREKKSHTTKGGYTISVPAVKEKNETESPDLHVKGDELNKIEPFFGHQVSTICDRLNLHNRLAKKCSFDCQGLFLSLFFKENLVSTEAVVSNLRENGFVAYIPRFDLRVPVYLRDSDGFVQIDPVLLGLEKTAGEDPTVGFAWSRCCRRFGPEDAALSLTEGEKLEVLTRTIPKLTLRPLDVVQVEIYCSEWDQRARIPSPRVHLVHREHAKHRPNFKSPPKEESIREVKKDPEPSTIPKSTRTVFDILEMVRYSPSNFTSKPLNKPAKAVNREEPLRGRLVYGGFTNPSTRVAAQLLAQEAAAAEALVRRNNAVQKASQKQEFSNTRRIEMEVTMRQQRLAKEKRESRRAKRQ